MNYVPSIEYPQNEREKLAELKKLFVDWHDHIASLTNLPANYTADDLVFDGFYPFYFNQKPKILFIGRESRGLSGYNNMDVLWNAYKNGKRIGKQSLNRSLFHRRMMYLIYGIEHDFIEYENIPKANELGDSFGTLSGISFAFMNLSKFSNDKISWQSDWGVIEQCYKDSTNGRNYIYEEVKILSPDIIITMGMKDKLSIFGNPTFVKNVDGVNVFNVQIEDRSALLLNTYHFSYPGMKDNQDCYIPICNAIKSMHVK